MDKAFLYGLALFLFTQYEAWRDGVQWRGKMYITKAAHFPRFMLRGGAIAFASYAYYGCLFSYSCMDVWEPFWLMMFSGACFWFVFDYSILVWAGQPLNHVGKTAFTDLVFHYPIRLAIWLRWQLSGTDKPLSYNYSSWWPFALQMATKAATIIILSTQINW